MATIDHRVSRRLRTLAVRRQASGAAACVCLVVVVLTVGFWTRQQSRSDGLCWLHPTDRWLNMGTGASRGPGYVHNLVRGAMATSSPDTLRACYLVQWYSLAMRPPSRDGFSWEPHGGFPGVPYSSADQIAFASSRVFRLPWPGGHGPSVTVGDFGPGTIVVLAECPTLLIAGVLALPALLWVVRSDRHLRLARRPRTPTCPACGYDLRATPDRCPECGEWSRPPRGPRHYHLGTIVRGLLRRPGRSVVP